MHPTLTVLVRTDVERLSTISLKILFTADYSKARTRSDQLQMI